MEPISFTPLYMERVWGGRQLASVYGRELPNDAPYGEAWELVDRENEQSVVDHGPFQGVSLHELWTHHRAEIFGETLAAHPAPRFPILIKILDARADLSIQVHPPADIAPSLGGEPKTEMWYIADRAPGAKLYVGLKSGITREAFSEAICQGSVEQCVHAVEPGVGDSIFIPSGRLHAIGAGLLIHEIQQNSDTTYRVFDWNRLGLDGLPRALHIDESLASIDFDDFEPTMDLAPDGVLADCEHFRVTRHAVLAGSIFCSPDPSVFSIVCIVSGKMASAAGRVFPAGSCVLVPAHGTPLTACDDSTVLQVSC